MQSRTGHPFTKVDARGKTPESWACIDCGINTAPGMLNRTQIEQAFLNDWSNQGAGQSIDDWSEVYMVNPPIWKAAGMEDMGGCLCIGCLEKRLGRLLTPKDFLRKHPFNSMPGSKRLVVRDYDSRLIDSVPFYYDAAVEKAKAMGSRCLLYTTAGHTPAVPRWRVLLILSKPETRVWMRKKYAARVNGFFGNIFARESFKLSQSYYYGRALDNPDADYRADMIDGKFIDLQDGLYKHEQDGMPKADKANDNEPDWENVGGYHSGRGFDAIMAELGDGPDLNGFHDPLCAAVASYVVTHKDDLDRKLLKNILREKIDAAPKARTRKTADIKRYKGDKFLDALIKSAEGKFASQPRQSNIPAGLRSAYSRDTQELNINHAVLPIGGKTRVVTFGELDEFPDRETIIMTQTLSDFAALMNKYRHPTTVEKKGKTETVYVPLGTYWLQSAGRRQYDGGMAFMPQHDKKQVGNRLNLWNDYGVKPIKPDGKSGEAGCKLFLDFMFKVICGGNEVHFDYLKKREAWIFQKRQRSEIAVGLHTEEEGVGKTFYESKMGHLLGNHAMHVTNPKHVIGAFNPHLETLLRLTADEALFVGNHEHRNALFGLITDPKLNIEPKGCGVYTANNFLNISVLSNSKHFVPISGTARRFFIPTLSADHKQDYTYFKAIDDQLCNEGGFAALLYYFLNEVDLTDFNVRDVPKTAGLAEQAALGRRGLEGLVEEVCSYGRVPCEHWKWLGCTYTSGREYGKGFFVFIDNHRDKELSQLGAHKIIKRLVKEWDCKATGVQREPKPCNTDTRISGLQWPRLQELRAKFEQRFGKQNWMHPDVTEWSVSGKSPQPYDLL
jgi:hypothetical protein